MIMILLGLLGIAIIVAGIYLLINWLNKKSGIIKNQGGGTELTKVIDQKIFFPALATGNQNVLFFSNQQESAFYKFSFSDKKTEKISENLDAPDNIIWSPDRTKGILLVSYDKYIFEKYGSPFASPETADGTATKWLYDFSPKKLVKQLNSNIQKVFWSPDSQKIFYHYNDETIDTLNLADPNGQNWQKLADLSPGWYGFAGWIDEENLVYFRQPTDVSGAEIYTINITSKQVKKLTDGTKNASVAPSGKWIIYELFHRAQENYTLAMMKNDGSGVKDFGLVGGVDKIVWFPDSQSLIAAIRESGKTTDTFYKINSETGQKEEIKYKSESSIDAQNLMLSADGKILYFTSDDYLYKLGL